MKSKKKAKKQDINEELRQQAGKLAGLCQPSDSGHLLYFGLDSLYFLQALSQGGYAISVLGNESQFQEMQQDLYWPERQLPLVFFSKNTLKSLSFYEVIFLDRVADRLPEEELNPLLLQGYKLLEQSGRMVMLFSKKNTQAFEQHMRVFQSELQVRKWELDTTFSTNYQILTVVK